MNDIIHLTTASHFYCYRLIDLSDNDELTAELVDSDTASGQDKKGRVTLKPFNKTRLKKDNIQ